MRGGCRGEGGRMRGSGENREREVKKLMEGQKMSRGKMTMAEEEGSHPKQTGRGQWGERGGGGD